MSIGIRVKEFRLKAGFSQQELADIVGTSKNAISKLERGESKKPSSGNLLPLAAALNIDPNWLVTGKGNMQPHAIRSEHYTYMAAAASVPKFDAKAEEARTVIRTLSLHQQPINDDVRGELNHIFDDLVLAHAYSEHETREPSLPYATLADNEATLLKAYRALPQDLQAALLLMIEHIKSK